MRCPSAPLYPCPERRPRTKRRIRSVSGTGRIFEGQKYLSFERFCVRDRKAEHFREGSLKCRLGRREVHVGEGQCERKFVRNRARERPRQLRAQELQSLGHGRVGDLRRETIEKLIECAVRKRLDVVEPAAFVEARPIVDDLGRLDRVRTDAREDLFGDSAEALDLVRLYRSVDGDGEIGHFEDRVRLAQRNRPTGLHFEDPPQVPAQHIAHGPVPYAGIGAFVQASPKPPTRPIAVGKEWVSLPWVMTNHRLFGIFPARVFALLTVLFAVLNLGGCQKYDELIERDQVCDQRWADMEAQLQRRYDLVPNLVSTVKASAKHEEDTLAAVTTARASATSIKLTADDLTDPAKMAAFQKAQDELKGSLSRLMMVQEKYPDLRANAAFHDLQVQLEGTENRILRSRETYNQAVREFNSELGKIGGSVVNKATGKPFKARVYFSASAESQAAPKVTF